MYWSTQKLGLAGVRFAHPTEQQTNSVSTNQASAAMLNSSGERKALEGSCREEQGIKAQWNQRNRNILQDAAAS